MVHGVVCEAKIQEKVYAKSIFTLIGPKEGVTNTFRKYYVTNTVQITYLKLFARY